MLKAPNNQELFFSRNALRFIDRDAVEQFALPSIILMENAAHGALQTIITAMAPALLHDIVIVCGSGNNGGDGYALARHLANHGCTVRILFTAEPKTNDASTNATITKKMGISILPWQGHTIGSATLIIDAIFGTGLDRAIQGIYVEVIEAINKNAVPCISLDIPSGMDCDTGIPHGCCIEAQLTITFVGQKLGFKGGISARYTGQVIVVDIGCPQSLLRKYGTLPT